MLPDEHDLCIAKLSSIVTGGETGRAKLQACLSVQMLAGKVLPQAADGLAKQGCNSLDLNGHATRDHRQKLSRMISPTNREY